jgi:CopG family transcriptional regulator, nickel-responsive regulator
MMAKKEDSPLLRFGVSIEETLLKRFDSFISSNNYKNRSEALRDLIRIALVEEEWENADEEVAGAIVLVYNHHKRELVNKLLDIQHDYNKYIISSQHIHLDHDNCLEIIVVKGSMKFIQEILSKLKSAKGVKHASLTKSTLGKNI